MFESVLLSLLALNLVFVPWSVDGDEICALYSFVAIILISLFVKHKRHVSLTWLFVLFVFAFITSPLNFVISHSIVNLFLALLAMKSIAERIDLKSNRIGMLFIVFSIISLVMLVFQLRGFEIPWTLFKGGPSGFSLMPWMMGCTAALAIPFVYKIKPILVSLLLPLLLLSHSSLCVFAGIVAFMMCSIKRFNLKSVLITLIGLLLVVAYLLFDGGIEPHRLIIWRKSFSHIGSFLTGRGLGSWAHMGFAHYNGTIWEYWRWAHNEFYQYFFEQGIIGFLILISWFLYRLMREKDRFLRASLLTLGMLCFFHPVMHFGKLSFLAVVIIAMIEAKEKVLTKA